MHTGPVVSRLFIAFDSLFPLAVPVMPTRRNSIVFSFIISSYLAYIIRQHQQSFHIFHISVFTLGLMSSPPCFHDSSRSKHPSHRLSVFHPMTVPHHVRLLSAIFHICQPEMTKKRLGFFRLAFAIAPILPRSRGASTT